MDILNSDTKEEKVDNLTENQNKNTEESIASKFDTTDSETKENSSDSLNEFLDWCPVLFIIAVLWAICIFYS